MSLILDALRKMEQERKIRTGGSVNIRPAVLERRDGDPSTPRRNLPLLAGAGTILLLIGIIAGLLVKPTPPESISSQPGSPTPAPPAPLPAAAVPPASVPAVAPPLQTTVDPIRPVSTTPAPALVSPPVSRHRTSGGQERTSPNNESGDGGISISGIAWQDERNLRRAVVNGSLVGEGAEVAGARIMEIRERSVRFSRGGKNFEVTYTSAFPSR